MDTLESLGLQEAFKGWTVIRNDDPPRATGKDAPRLLVGHATPAQVQEHIDPNEAHALAHLAVLPPGEDGSSRVVISGAVPPALRQAVEGRAAWLGEDTLLASRFQLLEGCMTAVQAALAAEALALGIASGIDLNMLHHAIGSAAGSSWCWRNLVPLMLDPSVPVSAGAQTMGEARTALVTALGIAADSAFPAPLIAIVKQLYSIPPSDPGAPSARIFDLWRGRLPRFQPLRSADNAVPDGGSFETISSAKPSKVAFVGLGAMGYGMANVLRDAGMDVVGWDVYPPAMDRFVSSGGTSDPDLAKACEDAEVLVLMVINAAQAEDVLFTRGAANALGANASVLLMCTVAPSQASSLASRLQKARPDLVLLDAPVSGGTPRAATGDLTILCAGLDSTAPGASNAMGVLRALSCSKGNESNLVLVPGGAGKGAGVKLVNQHLAGAPLLLHHLLKGVHPPPILLKPPRAQQVILTPATHIASTAIHLAFAKFLGLPLRLTRKLLLEGPAQSWMLGHRGQNMLDGLIQPPTSAINIFVKDSGLVVAEAETLGLGVTLVGLVQQEFIRAKARGWGGDDDSGLVRLWNDVGIDVRCPA